MVGEAGGLLLLALIQYSYGLLVSMRRNLRKINPKMPYILNRQLSVFQTRELLAIVDVEVQRLVLVNEIQCFLVQDRITTKRSE